MNVFYPLGAGSKHKNYELRMSLRGIEKYLKGEYKVFIVGEKPDWLQNIEHIPFEDTEKISDHNIIKKIDAYFSKHDESILFMNDDHFLLSPFEIETFPNLHGGSLEDYCKRRGNDSYGKRAKNSLNFLKKKGLTTFHYDIHTPIIYHQMPFMSNLIMNKELDFRDGYIIKSLYGNIMNLGGTYMGDCKFNKVPDFKDKIFSTHPHMKHSIMRFLVERFPKPCRYEIADYK